jgi:hypothetical protein
MMGAVAVSLRWKQLWVPMAAVLFAVSHGLPAIVHDSQTVWLGARAAAVAVFFPILWATLPPIGFLLSFYYPLLGLTVFGTLTRRAFATGAAIALVSTMALWGVCTPAKPAEFLTSTMPGGRLGLGYWLWLASGVCLLVANVGTDRAKRREQDEALRREQDEALRLGQFEAILDQQRTPRRLARWTVVGLVYAGIAGMTGFVWTAMVWRGSRPPSEAELREVEAQKRRMLREAWPDGGP